MKDLNQFIKESVGNAFKHEVKYSSIDWKKFKKDTNKEVFIGNYEDDPNIELAYMQNRYTKTLKHIGTYNKKTHVLYCDDIHLFGNEKI